MSWFNVDDRLPQSPEVVKIPRRHRAAAIGVWTLCGAYVSGQLTNGFVSDEVIRDNGGTTEIRRLLVLAGLWEEAAGGCTYTARGCRVPVAQKVQDERAATAQRVREHRARKRNGRDLGGLPDVTVLRDDDVTTDVTDSHGVGIGTGSVTPKASKAELLRKSGTELARADDSAFDLATSERGLSAPVKVGASRLVATVVPNGRVSDADRTMLRIKASELLATESEDDVSECLRIWLATPTLGANALPCCMAQVYKQRHNGNALSPVDAKVNGWLNVGKETE